MRLWNFGNGTARALVLPLDAPFAGPGVEAPCYGFYILRRLVAKAIGIVPPQLVLQCVCGSIASGKGRDAENLVKAQLRFCTKFFCVQVSVEPHQPSDVVITCRPRSTGIYTGTVAWLGEERSTYIYSLQTGGLPLLLPPTIPWRGQ